MQLHLILTLPRFLLSLGSPLFAIDCALFPDWDDKVTEANKKNNKKQNKLLCFHTLSFA